MTETNKRRHESPTEDTSAAKKVDHKCSPLDDANKDIWKSVNLNNFDIKVLYQYIRSGGDVHMLSADGYGILYLAAHHKNIEALRLLLLQPHIDVNASHGPHNERALHASSSAGHFDAVELLLENEANVDVTDALGHTPLSNSLFAKSFPCTELLLKAGASRDIQDSQGNYLIHLAVSNDFIEAAKVFLQDASMIDKPNARGLSPLALAISLGHMDLMRVILDHGADVNNRSKLTTVLHLAVQWNRFEAVQALVERGCNVNVINAMEETPLYVAVQQRKIDLVRYLVEHGADPTYSIHDTSVNMPLLYAANHGYNEMCILLVTKKTSRDLLNRAATMSQRNHFFVTAKILREQAMKRNAVTVKSVIEEPADADFSSLINLESDDDDDDDEKANIDSRSCLESTAEKKPS
ncbi:ankyrin repeat-containing domain protein [Radiomyces spectabilis]|uniref:ankyrin repeat-containing domain protein n=1 Tax=Radiomyces spectabilis TaxID=64574 RepID=UPI00221FAEB4|nr:ankyrin repeat-containing domain protein [Radiomyces spectabilis]KAI8381130.1 ankyrin repeat-containing domain protein [Radiomyces spectabilis]